MLKISCLHSAQSNIAVFEAARRELKLDEVILKHRVRADLLAAAEDAGELTPDIVGRTVDELISVGRGADGVLLTCSTLGPAASDASRRLDIPVRRVDQALAEEATRAGGTIIVLCAASTTIAPTRAMFEAAAMATSASVEVRLVPHAWDLFHAAREADYHRLVADAADAAAEEDVTVVALAQASMAGAAAYARPTAHEPPHRARAVVAAALGAVARKSS